MPIEDKLEKTRQELEQEIKFALLKKNMSQTELADLIHENRSKVNQAIMGNVNPKSVEIRKKIYRVLDMDGK